MSTLVEAMAWWQMADTPLPGGCLNNIKMSSYQYKDPHVKDKMVVFIFNMGISISGVYIEMGHRGLNQYKDAILPV